MQGFGVGRIVALLLLIELVALRIWDPRPVEALRQKSFDIYQLVHPRREANDLVAIIDIDEPSLRALGQWPWPRTFMADIVSKVAELDGVVVGFDVLFPEPDRSSPDVALQTFRGLDDATKDALRNLPGNDIIFAEAIRRSKVVLGQSGYLVSGTAPIERPADQKGMATLGPDPRPFLVDFPRLLRNLPILDEAAMGHGIFSVIPEGDGTVRRVPLVAVADGTMVPSLSLEMLRVVTGSGAILIKTDVSGVRSVTVRNLEIPTDGKGRIWIHFAPPSMDKYISAVDLLRGNVRKDQVAGKLVLVGTSAAGLLDLKVTPVHPALPGVELHAQLLESALTGSTLTRPSYTALVEIMLATLLSLSLIALAPRVNAGTLFALGGVTAALTLGVSWYCFLFLGLLLDYTFPLISSFLVYAVLVCTNYVSVSADRYRIRSAFSQYISCTRRGTGPVAGEADPRRRAARVDCSLLGYPRLHGDFRVVQGRPAGLDWPDQSPLHAAHERHHRTEGNDRQIHGRRHHGLLERPSRRPCPCGECLRGGACDAGQPCAAERAAPARGQRQ
jgi:adenylate cyclase